MRKKQPKKEPLGPVIVTVVKLSSECPIDLASRGQSLTIHRDPESQLVVEWIDPMEVAG